MLREGAVYFNANNDNEGFWQQLLGQSQLNQSTLYTVVTNVPVAASAATMTTISNNITTYPAISHLTPSVWDSALNYQSFYEYQYRYRYQNYLNHPANFIYTPLEESAAEKAARLERQAKRKAAECRAEELLFTILTPSQVKQYTDDAYFEQPVGSRIYRIRKGRSMNVELIEAGKPTVRFCAHPSDAHDTPVPDVMLSQMLMLKANEAEFLRIANRQVM